MNEMTETLCEMKKRIFGSHGFNYETSEGFAAFRGETGPTIERVSGFGYTHIYEPGRGSSWVRDRDGWCGVDAPIGIDADFVPVFAAFNAAKDEIIQNMESVLELNRARYIVANNKGNEKTIQAARDLVDKRIGFGEFKRIVRENI